MGNYLQLGLQKEPGTGFQQQGDKLTLRYGGLDLNA
jgi:hypothetical protein